MPDEFTVPREHGNDQLHLKILSPSYAHKDYEAVMETQTRLRKFSRHGWPREGFTIDENITDLERHEREFDNREAFAYTVVTPDDSRVLGCIYINPGHTNSENADHDAVIRYWVRESERELLDVLISTVRTWIKNVWPFTAVRFENVG